MLLCHCYMHCFIALKCFGPLVPQLLALDQNIDAAKCTLSTRAVLFQDFGYPPRHADPCCYPHPPRMAVWLQGACKTHNKKCLHLGTQKIELKMIPEFKMNPELKMNSEKKIQNHFYTSLKNEV